MPIKYFRGLERAIKKSKYLAKKCVHDGHKFDSLKEGNEYLRLKGELQRGAITNLKLHPRYKIIINGQKICTVCLDFEYFDNKDGIVYYIDVKAWDKSKKAKNKWRVTQESKLKKKMLEAQEGITVTYR
jgi:hypothetical protein